MRFAKDVGEAERSIFHMEMLMQGIAIPTDNDGLPFTNTVEPRKIYCDLPQQALLWTVSCT